MQGKRALIELVQTARLAQACDFHKQSIHIGSDLFVGGDDTEVGVNARCALVVVAGTEVCITLEHAVFAADNQSHFGMDFVAEYAVHDVRARLFQLLRPVDVIGFVKTRHQFDHDGNLFASQRGLHQCAHKLGIAAGTVDGHFDGQHIRIGSGFAYHLDNRIERLIRVVQQNRRLFDQFEYGAVFAQGFQTACIARWELQIRPVHQIGDGIEAHQIDRPFDLIQLGRSQFELGKQEIVNVRRASVRHFQAHAVAVFAVVQLVLNRGTQVFQIFFINRQIAVAREAELMAVFNLHAGKEFADMGVQNRRQEHKACITAANFRRHGDDARQNARSLHNRHPGRTAERIRAFEFDGEIERFV